ncbi:pyruvate, phosphate dikinase [Kibdelosporangium philippinense]|uniref:Pyruvate, phosphate dikinase n=1 Tax=Kibdelosporangium philippinense TaxID=211113 RepID=A0ABS8ZGB6_9PSEU|nr:PEP/pyruvate-binding domain-containing protein [Kibdelosporangium philippinense]MCE7006874.1 pyruvate, phosphate dikinase [Kibdelosporangium philippinense]
MTHPLILSLPDNRADLATVGGKGASLSRLAQAGLPVPPGFCVTTSVYRDCVSASGTEIPSDVVTAIRSAYSALSGPVAVRSSATAEDLPDLSFAGQHDTFLNIVGFDDVLDAVKRCWASLWTDRAVRYRARNDVSTSDIAIAVVVQEMVPAEAAGVMFTADPITGARDTIMINATWGLGEALVSGDVTPDTYVLTGDSLRSEIADKTVMTVPTAGGTATQPVADQKRSQAVLSDEQVRELAALGTRIQDLYGMPMDIEWAVHEGQFMILQARPITTLPSFEVWNDSLLGDYLWTCANLREAVPSVMTPATWSLAQSLALPPLAGHPTSGNIGGRFYLNISTGLAALTALGLGGVARRMAGQIFGEIPDDMDIPRLPLSRLAVLRATVAAGVRVAGDFREYRKNLDSLVSANPARCSSLRAKISAACSVSSLAALWHSDIADLLLACRTFDAGARQASAARFGVKLSELVGPADAALLLSGLHTSSDELVSLGPMIGLARLRRGEITTDEYMQAWGHRGHDEFEVSVPRSGEDPAWIKRLLDGMTGSPEELLARQAESRAAAWERLKAAHPRKAQGISRQLAKAAASARKRERARSEFARSFWVFRAFILRASELTGHDLFFLPFTEIVTVLEGATEPLEAIPARRAAYEYYSALPPYPTLIRGRFDPAHWSSEDDSSEIKGFPGVPGVVEGVARVVSTVEEAESLRDGEILVTTVTNIGWTPLFPRAAAVVTDIGAPLSHAAIVARELGIPAVVGCGNATNLLSTGDHIRVDGGKGTVSLVVP